MTSPPAVRALSRWKLELSLLAIVVVLFGDYLFSDRLLFGTDSIPGALFFRGLLVDFFREFRELPRWNPYILGGLPFIDATHGDTFFPSSLLQFAMPVYRALGHKLLLHVFLAGVFMAFYLRSIALRPAAVAWGAIAYMLCPVFVSYLFAGQDGKMYVTSLCPLVLGLLERGMRSGALRHFLGLGVALGFTILSAQIQMAYHLTWFLGALFVTRWLAKAPAGGGAERPGRVRLAGLFAASVAIGLLVASVQLVPAVAYVKHPDGFSVRSGRTDYEHATSWCLHPEEIASMVVPEFCNSPQGYWGRNPFKLNSDYVGLVPLFLAAVALRRRDATRLFLGGLALFCLVYSLGEHTPLHRLFYAVVPQVKLFRAPPLVMFGAAFALCALAAHALHDLETATRARGGKGGERSPLVPALGVAGALLLAGMAAGGVMSAWNDVLRPGLDAGLRQQQQANVPAFRSGAVAAALVLAAAALLWEALRRGRGRRRVVLGALLLLTVLDAWRVDRRFVAVVDPRPFVEPSPLVARLAEESRAEKFRVMPVAQGMQANELGQYGIESTLGFHDNELSWYRALRTEPAAESFLATDATGYPFLRVFNVKYIVHDQPDAPNPFPVPGYLPRFRVAEGWEIATGPAAVASRLRADDFDPSRTVLLEGDPGYPAPVAAATDEPGRVTGYEYRGNSIVVRVDAARSCLLVHAENWFPYWHCTDATGRERPVLRAYGALRAVALEPGSHELRWTFRSEPYEVGKRVSLIVLAAVGLAFAIGAVRRRGAA